MPQTAEQTPSDAAAAGLQDGRPVGGGARPSPWESAAERRSYYAEASAAAMASPARAMQHALGTQYAAADDEERWPLRRTVALVFTTCGAFWTMVYFIVAALIG